MKLLSTCLAAALAASSVAAHATFQEFWVGSTDDVGTCVRLPVSNSPVTSVTSNDIACNAGASASPGYCTAAAGSQVSVEMHQQPGDRTCTNEAIGGNHDGPVIIYMAKVDNALTAVGSSASWFKVAQTGYLGNDVWATDQLNSNCGKYSFTIPSCLPPGDYLVRAEVIALHVAMSTGGAQFYISCYTVKVTGGGSTLPSSTVKFPGAYSASDPGILFNLYGSFTSYTIPGPAVFTCGGSSGTSVAVTSAAPTTTTAAATTTAKPTTTKATTSAAPTTTSASTTGSAPLYGQCGGQGWNGPTTCASGTCKSSSQYYSQCLP